MAPTGSDRIYSATYSGVPVFEFSIGNNHVMRRRVDDYINATHILKVADHDKPARTRILEREVQKGVHEKVQGGYGKYQGTWVPLRDGQLLAERNHVLDKLRPIFDYVPGNVSPPQAPKHTTNSNKPRIPKAPNVKRIPKPKAGHAYSQVSEDYDNMSALHEDDSPDNSTIASASFMEEDDRYGGNQYGPSSRKRKRGQDNQIDQQHMMYADALLDYFMISASDDITMKPISFPRPPPGFEYDRPIDDQRHTALHWGAAMGDLDVVRYFLDHRADPFVRNKSGETPLIRAVLFTNNHEKDTMPRLVSLLSRTIEKYDTHNATVLHHIVMSTNSLAKKRCARYYLDIVLNKMAEILSPNEFSTLINFQDVNGDTALHIAARHNAKKCIRALQGRSARGDIFNSNGETADHILQNSRSIRHDYISSSPQPDFGAANGNEIVKAPKAGSANFYHSQSARSFSESVNTIAQDKGLQVSLALESEVREKDEDLVEGQRLQQQLEIERHQVRQATYKHIADGADHYDEEEEQRYREEEKTLRNENASLSEQIQHKELHHAVRSEEQSLPASVHHKSNGAVLDENELEGRRKAALELGAEQSKRRKLTNAVVEAQGAAGMSMHGEKLKRLVSVTCGVPLEEVPALTPELLEELQESKMDMGAELALAAEVA